LRAELYHETHGPDSGTPLVLLHGAMSTIETSFGQALPSFAKTRPVIAVEQQGHGHTPDIDRPLSYAEMALDMVALLDELGIEAADFYGYSMGAGIALEIAIRNPGRVRKLVVTSLAYDNEGLHPGVQDQAVEVGPEDLAGSVFERAFVEVAPDPANWPALIAKCNALDRDFVGWSRDEIESINAPTLVIAGDSDIVRPEHAVDVFRLRGGGVEGDSVGLPDSQLALLPGTTHLTIVDRADWLVSMISGFLEDPADADSRLPGKPAPPGCRSATSSAPQGG
jgi:pimeloyl-ACP methyl ester carboxylesterase